MNSNSINPGASATDPAMGQQVNFEYPGQIPILASVAVPVTFSSPTPSPIGTASAYTEPIPHDASDEQGGNRGKY